MRPIVLSIAGSDPSCGAGIQADLKAIEAAGGYAATVITAITAQNTTGVRSTHDVAAGIVGEQLDAVLDDLDVAAVKTGMLATAEIVAVVAQRLRSRPGLPLVVDPVLAATDGHALGDAASARALRDLLLPQCAVVTPNLDELQALAGCRLSDPEQADRAARALLEAGARAVLITGGHWKSESATDVLVTSNVRREFTAPRIATPHTHGTGCVLASGIATGLARGATLEAAIERAKRMVSGSIRHAVAIGGGNGPIDPLHPLHARFGRATVAERDS